MILGIDEVGRGPWAGPLVVGAVVLPSEHSIDGLNDSKKISATKRQALDIVIREQALGWGLGWVHAEELDTIGLSAALRLATKRAVENVRTPYHEIIIDGTINFLEGTEKGRYVTTMPKADGLIPAVSAASIIAKVARDAYMATQDHTYPEYGFGAHVGYGTAQHRLALETHGVTPLHRTSFAPIAKLLGTATHHKSSSASSKTIGDAAENTVGQWLEAQGFTIRERNWKTRYCEIDIVAEKGSSRYFMEVKYRSSTTQGGGEAAITPAKLKKMRFAAELYDSQYASLQDTHLIAIAVTKSGDITLFEIE